MKFYDVHKNSAGGYTVYEGHTMSKKENKAFNKKITKRWSIAALIVIGIIAMLVSGNIGVALIAGGIAFVIMYIFLTILFLFD